MVLKRFGNFTANFFLAMPNSLIKNHFIFKLFISNFLLFFQLLLILLFVFSTLVKLFSLFSFYRWLVGPSVPASATVPSTAAASASAILASVGASHVASAAAAWPLVAAVVGPFARSACNSRSFFSPALYFAAWYIKKYLTKNTNKD